MNKKILFFTLVFFKILGNFENYDFYLPSEEQANLESSQQALFEVDVTPERDVFYDNLAMEINQISNEEAFGLSDIQVNDMQDEGVYSSLLLPQQSDMLFSALNFEQNPNVIEDLAQIIEEGEMEDDNFEVEQGGEIGGGGLFADIFKAGGGAVAAGGGVIGTAFAAAKIRSEWKRGSNPYGYATSPSNYTDGYGYGNQVNLDYGSQPQDFYQSNFPVSQGHSYSSQQPIQKKSRIFNRFKKQ